MLNDCESCKEVLERVTELEENLEKAEHAIECLRMYIRGVQHGLQQRPVEKPVYDGPWQMHNTCSTGGTYGGFGRPDDYQGG